MQAWQRFMLSGFKRLFFSRAVYTQLLRCDLTAHRSQEQFWGYYFAADISRLRSLLRMFGGDHHHPESGNSAWLAEPAADIKAAMCQETARLYEPLTQVLQDLEIKYEDLIAAWRSFALAASITETALPPVYQISENTRNLLAYAAHIAFNHQQPLVGLQTMFPLLGYEELSANEEASANNSPLFIIEP